MLHAALLATLMAGNGAAARPPALDTADKLRAVSWVAGHEIEPADLAPVVELGAGWIAQTPFGWMRRPDQTEIGMATKGGVLWGETDAGLVATHRMAVELGLKTALKPHLWIRGSWPGEVAMKDAASWTAWFASYRRFILHYAALAQKEGMHLLVIGTELKATTASHEQEWRRLIEQIRVAYAGPITYAANWDEFDRVPFWDAVDAIGVNAYFPLLATADGEAAPPLDSLVRAWQPTAARLEALARRHQRPVLFTEIGYRATRDCAERPWEHQGEGDSSPCQSRALSAIQDVFWSEPWFGGVFIWKWFPGQPELDSPSSFSPQGRPGQEVLRRWFKPAKAAPAAP